MKYTIKIHLGLKCWQDHLRDKIYYKEKWYSMQSGVNKQNIELARLFIAAQRLRYRKYAGRDEIYRNKNVTARAIFNEQVHAGMRKILDQMLFTAQTQSGCYGLNEDREIMYEALTWVRDKCERYELEHYVDIRHKRKLKHDEYLKEREQND